MSEIGFHRMQVIDQLGSMLENRRKRRAKLKPLTAAKPLPKPKFPKAFEFLKKSKGEGRNQHKRNVEEIRNHFTRKEWKEFVLYSRKETTKMARA